MMIGNRRKGMETLPVWRGFHHIALVTRDLEGTVRFYEDVLGMQSGPIFSQRGKGGRHCFIKPGESESWGLHFFEYPEAEIFPSADVLERLASNPFSDDLYRFMPGALQHVAFALGSEEEGVALRTKLQRHSMVTTEIYDQGTIRNFIFTDNNGIQLEAAWPKEEYQEKQDFNKGYRQHFNENIR